MTVNELIVELLSFPPDMEVVKDVCDTDETTGYVYTYIRDHIEEAKILNGVVVL